MGKEKDVVRDFMHLSQAMAYCDEPIPPELVTILENCVDEKEDSSYKSTTKANLIAYAAYDEKIKRALQYIAKNATTMYNNVQQLAKEIHDEVVQNE